MEPFPWPKANECGTSPDCAMKTCRKDAHPGGLLTHSDIYSEAWREALLPVQLPSQMREISLSEDLRQTIWLFCLQGGLRCFIAEVQGCVFLPHQHHPTTTRPLSAVPVVGGVNDPLPALPET